MAERRRIKSNTKAPKKQTKKAPHTKSAVTAEKKEQSAASREIWAIITVAVGILLVLGFYFDALGALGGFLKLCGLSLFGTAGYALPVILFILGVCFLFKTKAIHRKGIYTACIMLCVCSLIHLFTYEPQLPYKEVIDNAIEGLGGGLFGATVTKALAFTGKAGTAVILIAAALIFAVLISGSTPAANIKEALENKRHEREDAEDNGLPPFDINENEKPKRKREKPASMPLAQQKTDETGEDFLIITGDDEQLEIKDDKLSLIHI